MIHYGWRSMFYVIGGLSLLWSILYGVVYRNMPEEHEVVSHAELARIRGLDEKGEIKNANVAKRPRMSWSVLAMLFAHGNMWAIMCAYAAYIYSLWFFLSWLPSYLVEYRHFTLIKTGLYASMPLAAGVVGDAFGGWLTDKLLVKTNNLRFSRRSVAIVAMVGCGTLHHVRGVGRKSKHGGLLPDRRDVLSRNDHWSRMGRSHGCRRRIFRNRFRHDEHGRPIRWRSFTNRVRISRSPRAPGSRHFQCRLDCCLSARPSGRSGSIRSSR